MREDKRPCFLSTSTSVNGDRGGGGVADLAHPNSPGGGGERIDSIIFCKSFNNSEYFAFPNLSQTGERGEAPECYAHLCPFIAAGGGEEETSENIRNSPTVDEGGQTLMSLSTPTLVAGGGGGRDVACPAYLNSLCTDGEMNDTTIPPVLNES